MIRVHIEIASELMRAGLETLLRGRSEIELVSSASDATVLVRDEVPEISEVSAGAPAVVLTNEFSVHDVWRSGARAILPRDAPGAQIIAAIYAASAGLVVFPADDTATVLPLPTEPPAEPLTPREMEVLEMLAEGLPNKLIAHKLAISDHTAKFHVNSILTKLNAGTRTEAVMRGVRLGLVKNLRMIAVSFGEKTTNARREPYRAALRSAEIEFIEDPPTLGDANGLVLTGGSDVDPARYNQENQGSESPDKVRDQREISLVRDALQRDIPILAICRGMQLLNVALKGTLRQHIDGHRVKEKQDAHSVQIAEGTKLASILKAGEYTVNSRHHQCVHRLGEGLIVSATAGDIIEALELPGHRFVVAVQWHPEDRIAGPDRKLFEAFASAVRNVTSAAPA